jgi:hypothetical protein
MRYKLIEANGQPRYLTQDEMHVVRDISTDGQRTSVARAYGANAIGTALAAERAAGKFFKSGMTAATVATYKGDMEDEDESALHASITRYAAGVENNFGLLLVPDDVTITNLGVEPEKAQMMLAREWTRARGRAAAADLAAQADGAGRRRRLRLGVPGRDRPRRRLPAADRRHVRAGDAARSDPREGHVLREVPPRRAAARRPAQLGEFIEKLIKNRAMRPSEVRMTFLDMNPDDGARQALRERQPAREAGGGGGDGRRRSRQQAGTTPVRMTARSTEGHAGAARQRGAVPAARARRRREAREEARERRRRAGSGLRDFYATTRVRRETMRISMAIARGYARSTARSSKRRASSITRGRSRETNSMRSAKSSTHGCAA